MVTSVCTFFAHGLWVQRAPGVPCALRFFGRDMMGIPRGETACGNAGVLAFFPPWRRTSTLEKVK